MKFKIFLLIIIVLTFLSCKAQENIPPHIGDFTVKIVSPGNEYYETPTNKKDNEKLPKLIEQKVKLISPAGSKISSWKINDNNEYSITSVDDDDRYYFNFTRDGDLFNLRYKNYELYKQEIADQMIIKGKKTDILLNQIPSNILMTLDKVGINPESSQTFITETIEGKRFIIVNNGMAYFIRSDGQIQAAGLVSKGALRENDSYNNYSLKTNDEILNSCDSLLSKYHERFDFENEIKLLKAGENKNSPFRFIVMGDSRSNEEVWSNIIKHINELKPKPLFIIHTGDLVSKGYAEQYSDYFVSPFLGTDIPFFVAIGNHDLGIRDSAIEYRYLFGDKSLNYYLDYGKFRFIMFDNSSRMNSSGEALPWLEKILSDTPKEYTKIIFAHRPPAIVERWSWHAWDKKNSKSLVSLLSKYNVKLAFFGHIHCYSSAKVNNIFYTVTGGGGAPLVKRFGEKGDSFHYIICDAMPDGTIKQKIVQLVKDNK